MFPQRTALRRALTFPALATTCALLLSAFAVPAATAAGSSRIDARERAVVHRINDIRAAHGLSRLKLRSGLSRAADRHSSKLHHRGVLSHQLPGERSLGGRLAHAARKLPVGEVVMSATRAGSAQIVRAWMNSAGHRELLLSGQFNAAGIGIRSGSRGLYATVDLAAR